MKVGVIGTGLMGLPMAQRLLEENHSLIAYNRTPEKLEPLRAAGADIATSPEMVMRQASCVVLMLTNIQAIRDTVLSKASRSALAGKTIIQMSTIAPTESRSLLDEIQQAGGEYLEAPVLGSTPEAKAGKLIVMVGSTAEQFNQWQPVLRCFGPEPLHVGEVGTAAAIKLALNQLIGSLTSAFATSLEFVQRQGAEVETFMQILRGSALYATTFDKKLQRMLDHNFDNPNFPTKHLLKDVNLFVQESKSLGLNPGIPVAVQQLLERTLSMGFADADYSALFEATDTE